MNNTLSRHSAISVDHKETHSSVLFFLGGNVLKMKKSVDLGFADFRDLDQRMRACDRELSLNRRLAPDVYLDVLTVMDSAGEPRECLLHMRRLPQELALANLVKAGGNVDRELRAVARALADFHSTARSGPDISAEAGQEGLGQRWLKLIGTARKYESASIEGEQLALILGLALKYVRGRGELLEHRVNQGFVKDGHGDLLASDVYCLPDGPRLLDCLDFDDKMRYVDVLDDVSFLAMDLEHLGRPDLGKKLLDTYVELSAVPTISSLEHHYLAYRAMVRAAVSAIGESQGLPHAAADVKSFTDLALAHLHAGAIRLVLVGGPPGSGKSTLATQLADSLGYVLIQSDVVRREFSGNQAPSYGKLDRELIYAEMLDRAQTCLSHGESVILDATWDRRDIRHAASQLATQTHSDFTSLVCEVPSRIAIERVRERKAAGPDFSDADERVAVKLTQEFEPWPTALRVSTEDPPEVCAKKALADISR